jgi:hypothetical protein
MDKFRRDVYTLDDEMFPAGPYFNVRAAKAAMAEEEIVVGQASHEKRKEAGFTLSGDRRVLQAKMRYRMDRGMCISSSFDPSNMMCTGCKERGAHSVVGNENGEPVVLVVTDQNFPAVMYSADEGQCIGIMRLEDGSIRDIGFLIGDMLDGLTLPRGSTILVGSVSDLGRQGLVGYSEELTRTLRIAKDKLGGNVQVVACPPILLGGINSYRLLRNIVEAEYWAEHMIGGGGILLRKTREVVKSLIAKLGVGKVKRPEENVHTLPKGVEAWEKVRMRMVGWAGMPARAGPMTEVGEAMIVEQLITELRMNFGLRLSINIILDRSVGGEEVVAATTYVMLGGSNCDRLGDTLQAMGKNVIKVTQSGWRPTRQAVETMVETIKEKVAKEAVVVLMGMDNMAYYEEDEEGTRRLPRRDEEGTYHIEGKLVMAAPRQVVGLVKNCREVLEEVPDNRKVLFGPGPRYLRCKCCDKPGHCSNFGEAGYRKELLSDMQEAKVAIGEVCRDMGLRSFKVTNPADLMGLRSYMEEGEVARLLGDDPVHYTAEGFAVMGRNLIDMVEGPRSVFQAEKRGRTSSDGGTDGMPVGVDMGSWRRGNTEWLHNEVSGLGGWRGGRAAQGSQPRGRGVPRGRGEPRGRGAEGGYPGYSGYPTYNKYQ